MLRRQLLFMTFAACDPSGSGKTATSDTGTGSDGTTESGSPEDTADDPDDPLPGDGCRAIPRDANADRTVLVNRSYEGDGAGWAVFTLSSDGTLTDTGASVTGGRTYLSPGVFTPDGSLGVVPLDDGTLTVFGVDDSGTVTVVEQGWSSGFYAVWVSMDASGERIWVADGNTEENGGGLYVIDLDCETGLPSVTTTLPVDPSGLWVPARLPAAVLPIPGRSDRLALVGGVEGADLTLVDTDAGTILDTVDVFGDDAWLAAGAISPRADLILLTDTSAWSGEDNSIAAVTTDGDRLTPAGRVDLFDGVAIGMGPDGSSAVVSSGYGDDIVRLALDASASPAVDVAGSLATSDGPPQLPGGMVTLQRGDLAGFTLVAEVYGLRSVMIGPDGEALDLGVTGGRLELPGALMVQP